MAVRKLEGTHKFTDMMVCDRCGHKVSFTLAGRSLMRDHLAAVHDVKPATTRTAP